MINWNLKNTGEAWSASARLHLVACQPEGALLQSQPPGALVPHPDHPNVFIASACLTANAGAKGNVKAFLQLTDAAAKLSPLLPVVAVIAEETAEEETAEKTPLRKKPRLVIRMFLNKFWLFVVFVFNGFL